MDKDQCKYEHIKKGECLHLGCKNVTPSKGRCSKCKIKQYRQFCRQHRGQ